MSSVPGTGPTWTRNSPGVYFCLEEYKVIVRLEAYIPCRGYDCKVWGCHGGEGAVHKQEYWQEFDAIPTNATERLRDLTGMGYTPGRKKP